MNIGRKIYFDITTGNIIQEIGESSGNVVPTTIEQDIESYSSLSVRNRETFDVIELEYGQFAQDFTEASSYRVNIETQELEFSYRDPNQPEEPQPYQKPLTEQIKEIKAQVELSSADLQGFMDFYFENGGM